MSNYYEYRDISATIAEILMNKEGWKVYGYYPDESDFMTDYWSPASWGGVAEKNGYILCVNIHGSSESREIKEYNYKGLSAKAKEKISKLEQITVSRGASLQEEESAKKSIARIKGNEVIEPYTVVGIQPGHMAHPPRCNWHVEKDGRYILKGTGLLKFRKVTDYYRYPREKEETDQYRANPDQYMKKYCERLQGRYSETQIQKYADSHRESMEEYVHILTEFNNWINKVDCACGSTLGDGEYIEYETIRETKYKKENKAFCTNTGEIKEGQCFMLMTNFNHGCSKGSVYRIHQFENGIQYAYKLNGKLTKECKGHASPNNYWSYFGERFTEWISKGHISWCEIKEVNTPYEVEKVVKKVVKVSKESETTKSPKEFPKTPFTYTIKESVHTKTGQKLWAVKVNESLSREDYIKVNERMKGIGGYYSRYIHAFVFKEDPTEKLKEE